MKYTTPRSSHFPTPYESIALASIVLLLLPACSHAQAQLRADKQILLESTLGTVALKEGLGDQLYVLNRSVPSSSIWVSDYSGTSMQRIVRGGSGPTEVRWPKELAVDRGGNVVVADGLIKVFFRDGRLFNSFRFDRPESVGVLSDGRILVSGVPRDQLISVFDRQGRMVGNIGEPAKLDDAPGFNAILNIGTIVVDGDDNIYYVFHFSLTPTVRKFTREGKLVAEWHPKSAFLDQAVAQAKKTHEESKEKGGHRVSQVLTAAAFDSETKTLWVASGSQVLQLDSSGETIRSFELVRPEGEPMQTVGLLVDRDFIRAATRFGIFEFFKPH